MRPRNPFPVFLLLVSLFLVSSAQANVRNDRTREPRAASTDQIGMVMRPVAAAASVHALSTSTFQGLVRCPAELGDQCNNPFGSIAMTNNTAYFRDVVAGAYTFISGATDGEAWTVIFTDPDGLALQSDPITFHSNYNGSTDCFVSPFQILCGGTSLQVLWYMPIQCQRTGTWHVDFTNTAIPTQSFDLKPQIEDSRIPLLRQSDYPNDIGLSTPNPYDEICKLNLPGNRDVLFCAAADPVPPTQVRWSIAAKGCFMSDVAMVLSYHGVSVNPSSLNGILVGLGRGGYDRRGNVVTPGAVGYARQQGVNISFPAHSTGSLRNDVCTYGPQLVRVPNRTQHWVTAYGVLDDGTILVRDPSRGALASITNPLDVRHFSGPAHQFNDTITGLKFTFHSPVEAFVTDPTGRRLGYDPLSQTMYNEIPNSSYDQDLANEDDETGLPDPNPGKSLEIFGDADGDYLVTVTGVDTGTYDAEIWSFDSAGNMPHSEMNAIQTAPNMVQTFTFHFDSANASNSSLSGAFDGGGQRPRDVNKFLTYGNPTQTSTTLPAGTTSFPLMVFYAANTLPNTFSAVLNGVNVSSLFHPAAGGSEVVNLSLGPGRSVLKLSIDGQLPSRVATDSDRLVLDVP